MPIRTLWLISVIAGTTLVGCGSDLGQPSDQSLIPVVAGISESRSVTPPDTSATTADDTSATSVEMPATVSGQVASRGEYQLFELGPGRAGERWVLSDANYRLGSPVFLVAMFDANYELLRRELVSNSAPLEHVLRADTDALYLGVTPALSNSGGDFEFDVGREAAQRVPAVTPQAVWLNFGAASNISVHARAGVSFAAFDARLLGSAYAGRTDEVKAAILETMRADYASYNVVLTTSDEGPAPDGPHATVHFGGADDRLLGLADNVDQYNEDPWQTAVIYVAGFADFAVMDLNAGEMGQMLGNVASHELGHLLGLFHTQVPTDLMDTTGTAWDLAGAQAFSRATLETSVFPFGYENCPQRLADAVGQKSALGQPSAKPIQAAKMARKAALRALARDALQGRCGTCLHLDE
jgi:hypothetical protein